MCLLAHRIGGQIGTLREAGAPGPSLLLPFRPRGGKAAKRRNAYAPPRNRISTFGSPCRAPEIWPEAIEVKAM